MILPIYLYGQPVLRKVAEDITPDYPNLKELIANMYETMDQADGVGLAAPQIGLPIRVVTIDLDVLSEDFPSIRASEGRISTHTSWRCRVKRCRWKKVASACRASTSRVRRGTKIHVKYMDEDWQEHDEIVEGYLARVMQHEFDHLEGKMFIDRLSPLRKQMIKGKLGAMLKGKVRCAYRVKTLK